MRVMIGKKEKKRGRDGGKRREEETMEVEGMQLGRGRYGDMMRMKEYVERGRQGTGQEVIKKLKCMT